MSAMRFYVFTPGQPGYISSEHAIRELPEGPDEARGWAEDNCHIDGTRRLISQSEALMVPLYREALERWEARDDGVLQETEVAEIRASRRSTVAYEAAELGCREAAAALAVDDDERIRAVINEHCHDEGCGGRDFPDEPRPRRLNVVS